MSRIGKLPIKLAEGVKIEAQGQHIKINGPKGELECELPSRITLEQEEGVIYINRVNNEKISRALHGLWRMLLSNSIVGVSTGWEKKLDFKGVGYRAEVQGNKLILNLGFSHPVEVEAPEGISFQTIKNTITVSGIDKQKVGQVAANIRKIRPVEPYKLKGLKYIDEVPRKKLGKAAKAPGK